MNTADKPPVSEARRLANRQNAARSTGPKTPEGKDRSRRNAMKHGLAATMIDAPGLDPEVERARVDAWMKELNPSDDAFQGYLVEQAVRVSFRLERCDHAQKALIAAAKVALEDGEVDVADETGELDDPAAQFRLVLRYEMQAERLFFKLIKDLRDRAQVAKGEAVAPTPPASRPVAPRASEPTPAPANPSYRTKPIPSAYLDESVPIEVRLELIRRQDPALHARIMADAT